MGGRRQEAPSGAAAAAGTAQGHRAEPGGSGPAHAGSGAAHSRQAGTSGAGAGRSLLVSAALTSVPGRGAGLPGAGWARALSSCGAPGVAMNIVVEFFVVTFKVLWAFVLAAARWLVRPKEKSVAGQVCLITGAGSGLGRLFALEFARRRALLVLWDINTQSNEETAGMVRHIYRDLEAADAAALQGNSDLRPSIVESSPSRPRALPGRAPKPHCHGQPRSRGREHPQPRSSARGFCS